MQAVEYRVTVKLEVSLHRRPNHHGVIRSLCSGKTLCFVRKHVSVCSVRLSGLSVYSVDIYDADNDVARRASKPPSALNKHSMANNSQHHYN